MNTSTVPAPKQATQCFPAELMRSPSRNVARTITFGSVTLADSRGAQSERMKRMERYNIFAAWVGILFGILTGIPLGLFFHKTDWLGGYDSWPRRLLRLGHISFFGIAFLNLAFGYTIILLKLQSPALIWSGQALIAAQITMPTICFASAFWKPARQLFFIPVASALAGAVGLLWVLKGALP